MAMNMQDLPSPLRELELHAVGLSDDDEDEGFSPPSSPSTATTTSSSRDDSESGGVAAHVRKNNKSHPHGALAKELELGIQDEQQQHSEHSQQHLTSDVRTFANTIIAFLGSGVLGLPFAFKKCGILCKYKLRDQGRHVTKYGEIGQIAMGSLGKALVNASLVISQSGFCVAYLIFIASNAHSFLDVSRELVVSVCVPPLIAFSLLKHMRELAYVALLADCMNFLGLAVVLSADLSYMALDHDDIEVVGVVSSIPFFFGVASYCFEGVGMVLPLENSMQHKANFTPILMSTVVIITSIYATFGICGYLAFGDATQDVITLNIEGNGGMATLVKLFLCAGLFFTYPVMLFPVFEVLQPLISSSGSLEAADDHDGSKLPNPRPLQNPEDLATEEKKSSLMRACVVLVTALIAAGVPNFGRFISFIGSTCCALLGFVLPTLFYLRIFEADGRTRVSWSKKLVLYTIMLLGVLAFGAGVYDALVSMF